MKLLLVPVVQSIVMSVFSALINSEAGNEAFTDLEERIIDSPNKVDDFFLIFLRALKDTVRTNGPEIEKQIMEAMKQ